MTDSRELVAPRARSSGLVVRALEGEVLIFDLERDQAHCLNQTAGFVWQHCDGQTSVETIRGELESELGTPVSAELVWKALSDLHRDHLLEDQASQPAPRSTMSRRDLMKRAGVAVAIPVIASIAVPTGAFAASARTCGSSCTNASQCMGCNGGGSNTQCLSGCGPSGPRCCANSHGRVPDCASKADANKPTCQCCSGRCHTSGNQCM